VGTTTQVLKRGCGYPQAGKIYMVVDTHDGKMYGTPTWAFTLCPTRPLPDDFKLSAQGMEFRPRLQGYDMNGNQVFEHNKEGKIIYDIWDWIGAHNYPNPLDWFLEVMELGFHQLIERTADFYKITSETKYYAVHARGYINSPIDLYKSSMRADCPKQIKDHDAPSDAFLAFSTDCCFGLLYGDVIEGTPDKKGERRILRTMPSFTYQAWAPEDPKREHTAAAFFCLPFGRMGRWQIYKDEEKDTEKLALKALEALDAKLQNIKIVSL
jgi:hypothetical protein